MKKTKSCIVRLNDMFATVVYDLYSLNDNDIGIICVHGSTWNKSMFSELATDLSEFCNTTVPDLIGRGNSSIVPDHYYNFDQYRDACLAVINSCGFREVVYVGYGLGGLIGIMLASMKNTPIVGLVLDEVSYEANQDLMIDEIGIFSQEFTSIQQIAEYLKANLKKSKYCIKDYMYFAIQNFRMSNNVARPLFDPKIMIKKGPNIINFKHLWDMVKCPVLLMHNNDSQIKVSHDMISRINVTYVQSSIPFRVKYTEQERKVIKKWIQSIWISNQKVRSHFEASCGKLRMILN